MAAPGQVIAFAAMGEPHAVAATLRAALGLPALVVHMPPPTSSEPAAAASQQQERAQEPGTEPKVGPASPGDGEETAAAASGTILSVQHFFVGDEEDLESVDFEGCAVSSVTSTAASSVDVKQSGVLQPVLAAGGGTKALMAVGVPTKVGESAVLPVPGGAGSGAIPNLTPAGKSERRSEAAVRPLGVAVPKPVVRGVMDEPPGPDAGGQPGEPLQPEDFPDQGSVRAWLSTGEPQNHQSKGRDPAMEPTFQSEGNGLTMGTTDRGFASSIFKSHFERCDKDWDGKLSVSEFHDCIKGMGKGWGSDVADSMVPLMSRDGKFIELENFLRYFESSLTVFDHPATGSSCS